MCIRDRYYTLPVVEKFNDVIWFSVAMSLAAFIFETVIRCV